MSHSDFGMPLFIKPYDLTSLYFRVVKEAGILVIYLQG